MSDRWVPRRDSRWSSERERARRTDRSPRSGESPPEQPAAQPQADEAPAPTPGAPSSTARIDRLMGTAPAEPRPHRGEEPEGSAEPHTLPDLPGDAGSVRTRGNRIIILGALLFLAMAVIFILPRLLDDGDNPETTPTPQLIQTPTPRTEDDGGLAAAPNQSLQDAEHVVCIDAGHGGWDTGRTRDANARAPAILEKEINLGMAWMLKERLESEGIGVVLTRPGGVAVNIFNEDVNGDGQTLQDSTQAGDRDELQARINICNEAGADLLISLHLNGFDDPAARGYEVLYTGPPYREFGDRNADLAELVYREVTAAYNEVGFETTPRGTLPDDQLEVEMHNYGSEKHLFLTGPAIQNADFTLVPSEMPGVVIEPVFITNDDDAAFIADPDNQRVLTDAYADGILAYFERYPEPPQ